MNLVPALDRDMIAAHAGLGIEQGRRELPVVVVLDFLEELDAANSWHWAVPRRNRYHSNNQGLLSATKESGSVTGQRSNERLILKSGTQPARSQSESINIYTGLPILRTDGPSVWPVAIFDKPHRSARAHLI